MERALGARRIGRRFFLIHHPERYVTPAAKGAVDSHQPALRLRGALGSPGDARNKKPALRAQGGFRERRLVAIVKYTQGTN
ncbi:MAG: hypothetical protein ACM3SO_23150 [Betaproteobacteria bacterium]